MVQEETEKYEVVVKNAKGEIVDTAHGTDWAGHSLGDHTTLIVIGGVTAMTYGAMVHSAVDEIPAVRKECLRLLNENEFFMEGLSRVQSRCTDLHNEKNSCASKVVDLGEERDDLRDERHRMRTGIKDVIRLLNGRMESPLDIDASLVTDICDQLSELVK